MESKVFSSYGILDKRFSKAMLIGSLAFEYENLDTMMHIIVAQNIGWNVTYVGNGVPHDELIFMANKVQARAMVIALNLPRDIARKTHEIKTIKYLLERHHISTPLAVY